MLSIFFVVSMLFANAQTRTDNWNWEDFEKYGIRFQIGPVIEVTKLPNNMVKIEYKDVWFIKDPSSFVYKGKTYNRNAFAQQLQTYFDNINLSSVDFSFAINGMNEHGGRWSFAAGKVGARTTISARLDDNFYIDDLRISGFQVSGVDELQKSIDRFEKEIIDKQKPKEEDDKKKAETEQQAQADGKNNTSKEKTDYWGETKTTTSTTTTKNDEIANKNAQINTSNIKMSSAFADMAKGDKDAAMQKAREAYNLNPSETNKKNLEVLTKEYNSQVKYEVNQKLTADIMKDADLSTLHGENGALATAAKGLGATIATGQINEALVTGGLSAILLGSAEAKAKKEAEAERIAEQKRIEEESRQKRLLLRNMVVGSYKDMELPKSTTKIETNTIYCFIYAIDNDNIDKSDMKVFISNAPFQIKKYSDGTWPYKKDIAQKAINISAFEEVIAGYWTTYDEALNELEKAIIAFKNSNSDVTLVSFEYSKSSTINSETDYWNNTEKKNKPKTKTDKYWDN